MQLFKNRILLENGNTISSGCIYGIVYIIFFLAYGILLQPHFSADTIAGSEVFDTVVHLNNGRPVAFIIATFFNYLGIKPLANQTLNMILIFMMTATCCSYILNIIIKNLRPLNKVEMLSVILAVVLSFVNVLKAEIYLFVEVMLMDCINVILFMFSFIFITKKLNLKNIFFSFLLLSLLLNSSQIYIVWYICFSLLVVYLQNDGKFINKAFIHSLSIIIIGGLASILNILITKILKIVGISQTVSRDVSFSFLDWYNNIWEIVKAQKYIWLECYGMLPRYSLVLFLFVITVLMIYLLIKDKMSFRDIIYLLLLMVCCYSIVFVPHILTSTIWLAQRTVFGIYFIFTFIIIVIVQKCSYIKIIKLLNIIIVIFYFINIYGINGMVTENIAVSKIDYEFCMLIEQKIERFEMESGKEIIKVGMINDISPNWSYRSTVKYNVFDTNMRNLIVGYSNVELLNHVTGKSYVRVPVPEEIIKENWYNKNWDYLDLDEQIIFQDDTMYMIMY